MLMLSPDCGLDRRATMLSHRLPGCAAVRHAAARRGSLRCYAWNKQASRDALKFVVNDFVKQWQQLAAERHECMTGRGNTCSTNQHCKPGTGQPQGQQQQQQPDSSAHDQQQRQQWSQHLQHHHVVQQQQQFEGSTVQPAAPANTPRAVQQAAQAEPSTNMMALDVADTGSAYLLFADVPGLEPDDLSIKLSAGERRLTIAGQRKQPLVNESYSSKGRGFGSMQCSWRLPEDAECGGIAAQVALGVVTITVPKKKHQA